METKAFSDALTKEHALLITELESLGSIDHTVAGDWVEKSEEPFEEAADENVVADRTEAWIERTGELSVLEQRINDVSRALEKIAAGTFGSCEICQADIEQDRLEANPAARTCKAHLNDEVDLVL